MNVFVNGILAATTGRSLILGTDSKQEAEWFEAAYEKIFPDAQIHSEAEYRPWLGPEQQEEEE